MYLFFLNPLLLSYHGLYSGLYYEAVKRSHLRSQNFIRRPQLVKTLIGHSDLKKHDTVYDIGAGSGVITSVLAKTCKKVVAIEFDQRMAKKLRENSASLANVDIIVGDILSIDLPDNPYKVFSNIPFHLSSPIVRKLTEDKHPPQSTYLIVQKQFAKKLLIGKSTSFTGLLGAMITPWFTTRIRYTLERTDFWPHPAVDTVMIELLLRDEPLLDTSQRASYTDFIEKCYSRQKYYSSLNSEIVIQKRPSELTAEEWVLLYLSSSKV